MVKRILVISDTHGAFERTRQIFNNCGRFDLIVHCGDYLNHGPRNPIPDDYDPLSLSAILKEFSSVICGVRGNCDSDVDALLIGKRRLPWSRTINLQGVNIIISHGHEIEKTPFSRGIAINGHSHVSEIKRLEEVLSLNPGSVALPKDRSGGSYGIIDLSERVVFLVSLTGKILDRTVF